MSPPDTRRSERAPSQADPARSEERAGSARSGEFERDVERARASQEPHRRPDEARTEQAPGVEPTGDAEPGQAEALEAPGDALESPPAHGAETGAPQVVEAKKAVFEGGEGLRARAGAPRPASSTGVTSSKEAFLSLIQVEPRAEQAAAAGSSTGSEGEIQPKGVPSTGAPAALPANGSPLPAPAGTDGRGLRSAVQGTEIAGGDADLAAAVEPAVAREGPSVAAELRGKAHAPIEVAGTGREAAAAVRPLPQGPSAAALEGGSPQPQGGAERALSSERAADVLRQVRLHLAPQSGHATIQLEPASLGRISIRIALRRGRVDAELRAEHPATLSALERHVPELKAALARQGIDSGDFELSLGFQDRSDADASREQGARPRSAQARTSASRPQAIAAPQQLTRALAASLGVDTYA